MVQQAEHSGGKGASPACLHGVISKFYMKELLEQTQGTASQ